MTPEAVQLKVCWPPAPQHTRSDRPRFKNESQRPINGQQPSAPGVPGPQAGAMALSSGFSDLFMCKRSARGDMAVGGQWNVSPVPPAPGQRLPVRVSASSALLGPGRGLSVPVAGGEGLALWPEDCPRESAGPTHRGASQPPSACRPGASCDHSQVASPRKVLWRQVECFVPTADAG